VGEASFLEKEICEPGEVLPPERISYTGMETHKNYLAMILFSGDFHRSMEKVAEGKRYSYPLPITKRRKKQVK